MLPRLMGLLAVFLSLGQATLISYVSQTSLGGLLYLINRDYALMADYVPSDLRQLQLPGANAGTTLREEAAEALEALFLEAGEEGHELIPVSGYRSYQKQRTIYRRKLAETGSARKAQQYVSPPGSSEHQLGLAVDIARRRAPNLNHRFGGSDEGIWVTANAHRFGFIIRYPAEWTEVTGYAWEPWHLRYVGADHAERLHALQIPLEHYVRQLSAAYFGELIAEVSP